MLRKLAYLFIIIFFAISSLAVYAVVAGLNATRTGIVEPVGELFRQLAIEATPVIVPDPKVIVQEVNRLARLETASVELSQVITAERNREMLWGAFGENLVFVAYGEVVAGVDLSRMSEGDIRVVDPQTVMIYLPPAEVFNPSNVLDTERSYIALRNEGLFAEADPQLETAVRQQAQAELLAAADERGILRLADENARDYLTRFLNSLGFTNVIFTDAPPPPGPAYQQEIPKGFVVTPAP